MNSNDVSFKIEEIGDKTLREANATKVVLEAIKHFEDDEKARILGSIIAVECQGMHALAAAMAIITSNPDAGMMFFSTLDKLIPQLEKMLQSNLEDYARGDD